MLVMVVELRASHAHAGPRTWGPRQSSGLRDSRSARSSWSSHVSTMLRDLSSLPVVDLGHPPHSPAPQPGVLVAIPPTIHRPLNEAALSPQARIQLCQSPPHGVAFRLIVQAITFVLILGAASSRVHAIFGLEVLGKIVDVDGLHVAPDRVLHLDAVSGVLESNPLNAILVLPYDERGRGRNRSWCGIRINARCGGGGMHTGSTSWRTPRSTMRTQSGRRSLQWGLRHARLGASG